MRRTKTVYSKSRLHSLLWLMVRKYQPNCCICGEPFTEVDLPARGTDLLTEHHLDGNHLNSALGNRELAHRRCHKSYHAKDNINNEERLFWRQFKDEKGK